MPMDIIIMKREYKKVVPLVCARWERDRDNNRHDQLEIVKCSNCGVEAFAAALFVRYGNYCPNCGAEMEGDPEAKSNWNGGYILPEIENKQTGNNAEEWLNKKMNIGDIKKQETKDKIKPD